MTDNEYAVCIYCQVFRVDTDNGDAYVRGILDTVAELTEREQILLERRFRHGMSLEQAGQGITSGAAYHINKALRKLRHPYRYQRMSVAKIIASREQCNQRLAEADKTIFNLQKLVFMLSRGISAEKELDGLYDARALDVAALGFSVRVSNALQREWCLTLEDIYKIDSYERLQSIKHLGVRYQAELIGRMRELGFTDWADRIESTKPKKVKV